VLASHQLDATIICFRFNALFSTSFVVAGADLRHLLASLRKRAHQPAHSSQQKEHYRVLPSHPGFWYRNGCEMFFACQRSFGYGLVSSEVSHLTATLVKRL